MAPYCVIVIKKKQQNQILLLSVYSGYYYCISFLVTWHVNRIFVAPYHVQVVISLSCNYRLNGQISSLIYAGVHVDSLLFSSGHIQTWICSTHCSKNIKFYENNFSGGTVVLCGRGNNNRRHWRQEANNHFSQNF